MKRFEKRKLSVLLVIMMIINLFPAAAAAYAADNAEPGNVIVVGRVSYGQADILCDGVADDIEWQQAIDEMNAMGGGTVKVLPGVYYPKKEIEMKSNVTLKMEDGAVLKLPDQVIQPLAAPYNDGETNITVADSSQYAVGMSIGLVRDSAPGYKYGDYSTITAINGNTLTIWPAISNSYNSDAFCISHYGLIGIHNRAANVSIIGGEFDIGGDTGASKINIVNADSMFNCIASSDFCDNLTIKNVYTRGAMFRGIHLWGSHKNAVIEGSRSENNKAGGIVIDTLFNSDVKLINTISKNNSGTGLLSTGVQNMSIVGGDYSNNQGYGIELTNIQIGPGYAHDNTSISNASVKNNSLCGITVNRASNTVISNNVIEGNGGIGIIVDNYSKWTSIANNRINNFDTGISEKNSDLTVLWGNTFGGCRKDYFLSGKNSRVEGSVNISTVFSANKVQNYNSSLFTPTEFSLQGRTITNLLGSDGNIALNAGKYSSEGPHGKVFIWGGYGHSLVKEVDGEKVLDGMFSDFDWNGNPYYIRSNFIRVPSLENHKYLLTMKVKNKFTIAEVNSDTGAEINEKSMDAANWSNLSYIANGTGKDMIFLLRSDYITQDKGYCKDIQLIDLTTEKEENLSIEELESLHGNTYIDGTASTEPFSFKVTADNDLQGDLLDGVGDFEANGDSYFNERQYGPLNIWGGYDKKLVKTVDGYKVLDGMFSDFDWVTENPTLQNPRCSFIRIPSIKGHNYVVTAKVKGEAAIWEVSPDTGSLICTTSVNVQDWTNITYKATGTGKDLVFLLRSTYIIPDSGYFRDIKAFDLSYRNDNNLEWWEVRDKYTVDENLKWGTTLKEFNIPYSIRGIGDAKDTIDYKGILTRRVGHATIDNASYTSLEDLNNVSIVTVNSNLPNSVSQSAYLDNTIKLYNYEEFEGNNPDRTSNIGRYYTDADGSIKLIVEKGKYADLNSVKDSLANIEVDYVLHNPTVENINTKLLAVIGKNTNITFTSAGKVLPVLSLKLPKDAVSAAALSSEISQITSVSEKEELFLLSTEPSFITLSGRDDISINRAESIETTYTASVRDKNNNVISSDVIWRVFGSTQGVTIDQYGKVTISKDALGGSFVIVCESKVSHSIVGQKVVRLSVN